jgi:hypothetical protein
LASPNDITPHKFSARLLIISQWVEFSGRAFLSLTKPMAVHTVDDSNEQFEGVTPQASAAREAPAQAELRPICAGSFRVSLQNNPEREAG